MSTRSTIQWPQTPLPDEGFTREVRVYPSFDHRDDDDPKLRDRGCGAAIMLWILRGPAGVITVELITGWMARPLTEPYPGHGWKADRKLERDSKPGIDVSHYGPSGPTPGRITSHLPRVIDGAVCGLESLGSECTVLLDAETCYGDGGYMAADPFWDALVTKGSEAAWAELEDTYEQWIGRYVSEPTA